MAVVFHLAQLLQCWLVHREKHINFRTETKILSPFNFLFSRYLVSLSGVKQLVREAVFSPLSSADIKNLWSPYLHPQRINA